MRTFVRPQLLAALCFGLAAFGPIGSWALLLFTANPSGLDPLQGAVTQLQYTFSSSNEQRLWFVGWALLPLLLLALVWATLTTGVTSKRSCGNLLAASAFVSLFSLLFWPAVAFLAALGTCCAVVLYRAA